MSDPGRILVVDDESFIRRACERTLRRRDPHVCATTTASQPAQTHLPRSPMSASRALESIGPAHLHHAVSAGSFRGEPSLELLDGPGEIGPPGMKKLLHVLLIACFFTADISQAAESANETVQFFEEEAQVITASRRKQSVRETPMSVEVITAEEIKASGAVTICDLFRFRAGMDVVDGRSFGSVTANAEGQRCLVSIRGFVDSSIDNMLVLIDGRSVFTHDSNIVMWEELPVQIQDIERIEIVRGPNAALFGSNAGVGVINILTKKPAEKFAVSGSGLYGSLGQDRHLQQESMSLEQAIKNFNYRLSYTHRFDDGFPKAANNDKGNDFAFSNKMNFRGILNMSDATKLDILSGLSWDTIGTGQTNSRGRPQDRMRGYFEMLKLSHELGADSSVEGFLSRSDQWTTLVPAFGGFNSPNNKGELNIHYYQHDAEAQHRFAWMEGRMQTVWGAAWHNFIAYSDQAYAGAPRVEGHVVRGFASDSFKAAERLTLIGAASLEDSDLEGFAPAYQVAAVSALSEHHTIRAMRSFSPTQRSAFQLHANEQTSPTAAIIGNPDLTGAKLTNWEIDYVGDYLDKKMSSEANLYYTHNRDVDRSWSVKKVGAVTFSEPFPQDETIARGAEFKLGYHWTPRRSVYANYTLESITTWSALIGQQQGTPVHKLNFGGMSPLGSGFSAGLNVGYKDTYRSGIGANPILVKAYWRMDARVAYNYKNTELFVASQNLIMPFHGREFSTGSASQTGNLSVPRLIYAGASVKF